MSRKRKKERERKLPFFPPLLEDTAGLAHTGDAAELVVADILNARVDGAGIAVVAVAVVLAAEAGDGVDAKVRLAAVALAGGNVAAGVGRAVAVRDAAHTRVEAGLDRVGAAVGDAVVGRAAHVL